MTAGVTMTTLPAGSTGLYWVCFAAFVVLLVLELLPLSLPLPVDSGRPPVLRLVVTTLFLVFLAVFDGAGVSAGASSDAVAYSSVFVQSCLLAVTSAGL